MKRRRVSDADLEQYLLFRLRYRGCQDLVVLRDRLLERPLVFPSFPRSETQHIIDTLGMVWVGWFYSLVDTHRNALKIWPLWRRLFPHRLARIKEVEAAMQPVMPELELFRHTVAFHVNPDLARVRAAGQALSPALSAASVSFIELAEELIAEEPTVLGLRRYLKANDVRCT